MTGPSRYPIPAAIHRVDDEIKRSRFVTTVAAAPTVEAARAFVARIKAEFSDATHHCWAYVVGPPGNTRSAASSDDGEPGGSAGAPMLNVLINADVGDAVVVVTRYFGGVKLGKGGLARAYGGGVQRVLREAPRAERVVRCRVRITTDYASAERVTRVARAHDAIVADESYGDRVSIGVDVAVDEKDRFVAAVGDATGGQAVVTEPGAPDGKDSDRSEEAQR